MKAADAGLFVITVMRFIGATSLHPAAASKFQPGSMQ